MKFCRHYPQCDGIVNDNLFQFFDTISDLWWWERGEGVGTLNFQYKKNKFENNGKNIKAQDSPAGKGLYLHNLVIRGAGNIICVHIPTTETCLLNFANKRCKKCLLYEFILS